MGKFVIGSILGAITLIAIVCISVFIFRMSFYIVGFIFETIVGIIAGIIVFLVILTAMNR